MDKKELFHNLGTLMITQKLLNDYIKLKRSPGVEAFVDKWMEDFGLEEDLKKEVLSSFLQALSNLGKI